MVAPITDTKVRAELSYEIQQRIEWGVEGLRILKDTGKDGLMPDGGGDPTNSRLSRVRETMWSLYEDLARSLVEVLIDCCHDARGLVGILNGSGVPEKLQPPTWREHE